MENKNTGLEKSAYCCSGTMKHPGVMVAASLIIAAIIFSWVYNMRTRGDDALTVTGSAKKEVSSDTVKWSGNFSRSVLVSDLRAGYDLMAQDLATVKKFFQGQGIAEKDINISPVVVEQTFRSYNGEDGDTGPREYVLRQRIEVSGSNIGKITEMAKNVQPLVNQGVFFTTDAVEYYYSKLPDLRVELLGEAVKDAQVRAREIAKNSGRGVGTLKSADMGVVQVLPVNSVDVSDYGSYDTSSIQKEIMVTVRTAFTLR
ncbi:MAG: SIMPL domain-containing protein [Candidatus Moranbacteria bacterium]|nr:SIMPL domain-containing protein [Candidatus Moranbacteria bacterium]